jgi:hypothetical protein
MPSPPRNSNNNGKPPTWFMQSYEGQPSWKKTLMSIGGFIVMFGAAGVIGYLAIQDKLGLVNGTIMFLLAAVGLFVAFPKGFAYLVKLGPNIANLIKRK